MSNRIYYVTLDKKNNISVYSFYTDIRSFAPAPNGYIVKYFKETKDGEIVKFFTLKGKFTRNQVISAFVQTLPSMGLQFLDGWSEDL